MKKTIAALILASVAQSSAAGGFAPWNERSIAPAPAAVGTSVTTAPGFAPWRDRAVVRDVPRADDMRMGAVPPSAFRPWS